MAGEAKAPDNRLFQLVMVIITSIVAPLTIYFVTNSDKKAAPEPPPAQSTAVLPAAADVFTPTPLVVVVTATTLPEASPTATFTLAPATPTSTSTPTPTFTVVPPTPTETGVRNPKGIVPAGTVVLGDGFSLVIDPGSIRTDGEYIRLSLRLQNTGSQAAAMNYTVKAITVKDDTGRTYAHFNGDKGEECKKQEIGEKRSLKLEPGVEVTLESPERKNATWWCSADHAGALPLYKGPLHKDAKALLVQINGLGPFSGFTVKIDR